MKDYYSKRASEYERIYFRDDPIRQSEQNKIAKQLKELFLNRNVLEVACGTGYWTERIAKVASTITAVDISNETLAIARGKKIKGAEISFIQGDAYSLQDIDKEFNAGCANFWFSHIPKKRIDEFLTQFHQKIGKDSVVFMTDNNYIEAVGGKLIKKENDQDTYKVRELNDGTTYEILKNYYSKEQLRSIFEPKSKNLQIHVGECFWWVQYIVAQVE